ncbi:MAG: acetyl-CoA carboxylase biotin carboxyl carrier protein subunit [candidate division WOR-3 bacterium]
MNKLILFYNSRIYIIEKLENVLEKEEEHKDEIFSPITGKINSIKVREGENINKGDVILTIESMKMEMIITSPKNAIVEKVYVKENEVVGQGKLLVKLKFLE